MINLRTNYVTAKNQLTTIGQACRWNYQLCQEKCEFNEKRWNWLKMIVTILLMVIIIHTVSMMVAVIVNQIIMLHRIQILYWVVVLWYLDLLLTYHILYIEVELEKYVQYWQYNYICGYWLPEINDDDSLMKNQWITIW